MRANVIHRDFTYNSGTVERAPQKIIVDIIPFDRRIQVMKCFHDFVQSRHAMISWAMKYEEAKRAW